MTERTKTGGKERYGRKNGIEPVVTICHFDIPLNLVDKYGSWRNRKVIDCYLNYCDAVFRYFKDKVRYWITFNEINMLMHLPFIDRKSVV